MKFIRPGLFLLLLVSTAWSQQKTAGEQPNFTGTWLLDVKSLSKSAAEAVSDYVLTIEHTGDEIRLRQQYKESGRAAGYSETIYTDERKEENVDTTGVTQWGDRVSFSIKSKSAWKKRIVVHKFIYDTRSVGTAYLIDKQTISLSADGKVLTITTFFEPNTNPRPGTNPVSIALSYSSIEKVLRFSKKIE